MKRVKDIRKKCLSLDVFRLNMSVLRSRTHNSIVIRLLKNLLHFSRIDFQPTLKNLLGRKGLHANERRNTARTVWHSGYYRWLGSICKRRVIHQTGTKYEGMNTGRPFMMITNSQGR